VSDKNFTENQVNESINRAYLSESVTISAERFISLLYLARDYYEVENIYLGLKSGKASEREFISDIKDSIEYNLLGRENEN